MKRILAVFDKDRAYAGELASYANDKGITPFSVIAVDDLESLRNFTLRLPVELLLNGTDISEDELKRLDINQIVTLTEEGKRRFSEDDDTFPEAGKRGVFRYQNCDDLFREVMGLYKSREGSFSAEGFSSEIIGICSPIGRCGKSGFALTLGRVLAESCKVIYLDLEECSGLSALTHTVYRRTLSDVIYAFRQGNLDESILGSATYQLGMLDYLAPVACPEDMEEIRAEELAAFTWRLAAEEHYEVLILDIGNLSGNAFPLLERCSVIYSPVTDDAPSQAKMAEWKEQLQSYGGDDLLERVRILHLPTPSSLTGCDCYLDSLFYGEMGRVVRELLNMNE